MPPPATKKRKTATGAIATGTGTRRTTRSQKPLLSIEMIGKVGSFANYDNGDLMNICKAVGPKDARIVRHVCLRNNALYLYRIIRKNLCKGGSGSIEEAKEELSHWMEINSDWRLVSIEEWTNDDECSTARIEEDGKIMVKLSLKLLFNNPAVAIELGRVDILKHLVEKIGIDVNAHRWSGYTSLAKCHLLSLAAENDKACFNFLISRKDIDVCAAEGSATAKLWQMFFLNDGSEAAEVFDAMISHPSFDPNESFSNDEETMLPLHYACSGSIALCEREETDHLVTKTKRLLDLGADPLLTTNSLGTPLEEAARILRSVGEDTEQGKTCKRLIAMMEEKIAAGK